MQRLKVSNRRKILPELGSAEGQTCGHWFTWWMCVDCTLKSNGEWGRRKSIVCVYSNQHVEAQHVWIVSEKLCRRKWDGWDVASWAFAPHEVASGRSLPVSWLRAPENQFAFCSKWQESRLCFPSAHLLRLLLLHSGPVGSWRPSEILWVEGWVAPWVSLYFIVGPRRSTDTFLQS